MARPEVDMGSFTGSSATGRHIAAEAGRHVKIAMDSCINLIVLAANRTQFAQAHEWAQDMRWLWDEWLLPFGQGHPEWLIGDPDTICRRPG